MTPLALLGFAVIAVGLLAVAWGLVDILRSRRQTTVIRIGVSRGIGGTAVAAFGFAIVLLANGLSLVIAALFALVGLSQIFIAVSVRRSIK